MQVRSPLQMYHSSSATPDHTNGRAQYPVTSPNQLPDDQHNMNPYHQHHHHHQQQQQQGGQRPAYPPTLPSLQPPNMGYSGATLPSQGNHQYGYAQAGYALPPPQGIVPTAAPPQQDRTTGFTGNNGRYKFELRVEQQPQRARMCGFGDKDRRPITPPPCIRLVILDAQTDKAVNIDDVDGSFFVLQVDLWDAHASREVNIVRASSNSPAVSISTATTTSFPPTPDRPPMGSMDYTHPHHHHQPMMLGPDGMPVPIAPGYPGQVHRPSLGGPGGQFGPPYGYSGYGSHGAAVGGGAYGSGSAGQHGSNNFTRNLIGSLTVNASRLKDTEGKDGYWFVLQDLSVRTEGIFRLKMNFIDVGMPTQQTPGGTHNSSSGSSGSAAGGQITRGRAHVLASVFSDSFQVFSAKKFPGVIESTPLSKCFASQGIKIPIRKDNKGEREIEDDE